jgi:hypothetical protein
MLSSYNERDFGGFFLKTKLIALSALAIFLAACESLAKTAVVQTQTAAPTDIVDPTASNTARPTASDTAVPVDTNTATATHTFTPLPFIKTATASITPELKGGRNAPLRFENKTDEIILVVLPSHNNDQYAFSDSWNLYTPFGEYEYIAWIGDDGPYVGTFRINNIDKHTLTFSDGKVKFHYP